ncbi:MAG TPA: NUDIX domain-containing protein [Actinomycetota bacterium]
MDPGDELVDVVDEQNEVVGVAPRRRVRSENLWHRCTYVFVLNAAAHLYVDRRTDTKDVYPGFYDVGAGGVNAGGESYEACARRELEEELGITAEPTLRFRHRYEGPSGRVWGGAFDVLWDGPIVWQPSEVVWGAFVPFDEADAMIAREPFCPDGLEVFQRCRREVRPS